MNSKQTYRDLCKQRTDIPLFLQPWWLDSTDMPWDVILYQANNQILGVFVYSYCKKWGKTIITQPTLTQYGGPFLFYPDGASLEKQYSLQNKAYNYFIEQLEARKYHFIKQTWHHSQQNWQPFYWNGFTQTTRYTYVLKDIANKEQIWQGMSHRKRQKNIAKTEGKLSVRYDMNVRDFYQFYVSTLQSKNERIFYPFETLEKLFLAAKEQNQAIILSLYDEQDILHVALLIVWDETAAYNLIIAINPRFRGSGATSRIIWEAILFLKDKTKHYDFEGSMIQGVALKNQSFGALQLPYHQIQKSHSKLYSLWHYLKTRGK
jgi:hypothetical protein